MPAVELPDHVNDSSFADPLVNVLQTHELSATNSGRSTLPVIMAAVLALPLGTLVGPFGPILWLFSIAVLSQLLVVAIHELGHLAAAWVADFHIEHFVVGPLAIIRNGPTFRLAHNRSKGIGGYVAAIPNHPDTPTGWLIAYFAAGAVANLFVGTLLFAAYLICPMTPLISVLVLPLAILLAVMAIMGLIPIRVGALSTDGRMILNLLRTGPERARVQASWRVSALVRQTQRPDWEPATIEAALSAVDGSMLDSGASYMAYLHHLDAGRDDQAAQFIERSLAIQGRAPLLLSSAFLIEATYFFVRRGSSPSLARDILTRIGTGAVEDVSRFRAEAAVLLAEGQTHLAAQTARRAIKLSEATPDLGIAIAERDLALDLLRIAESSERRSLTMSESVSGHEDFIAVIPIT